MQYKKAIAIFSRVPEIHRGGRDEPFAALPWEDLDTLFVAMLGDLVEMLCTAEVADVFLYRDEKELSDDIFSRFRSKLQVLDLPQGSFAEQVQQVIESVFGHRYDRLLVILENNPMVPLLTLKRAFQQLECEDDCLVYGPTIEGKCTFLGMKSNHSNLFSVEENDPLGKPNLLLDRLCASDTVLFPMPVGYSLDSGLNLALLKQDIEKMMNSDGIPHRTHDMFKMLDKKYKMKKASL